MACRERAPLLRLDGPGAGCIRASRLRMRVLHNALVDKPRSSVDSIYALSDLLKFFNNSDSYLSYFQVLSAS